MTTTNDFIFKRLDDLGLITAGWHYMRQTMSLEDRRGFEKMISMPGFSVEKFENDFLVDKVNPFEQNGARTKVNTDHNVAQRRHDKITALLDLKTQVNGYLQKHGDPLENLLDSLLLTLENSVSVPNVEVEREPHVPEVGTNEEPSVPKKDTNGGPTVLKEKVDRKSSDLKKDTRRETNISKKDNYNGPIVMKSDAQRKQNVPKKGTPRKQHVSKTGTPREANIPKANPIGEPNVTKTEPFKVPDVAETNLLTETDFPKMDSQKEPSVPKAESTRDPSNANVDSQEPMKPSYAHTVKKHIPEPGPRVVEQKLSPVPTALAVDIEKVIQQAPRSPKAHPVVMKPPQNESVQNVTEKPCVKTVSPKAEAITSNPESPSLLSPLVENDVIFLGNSRSVGTPDSSMTSEVSEPKVKAKQPDDPEKWTGREGRRYRKEKREAEKLAQSLLKIEEPAVENQQEEKPENRTPTGKEKRRLKDKLRKEKKAEELQHGNVSAKLSASSEQSVTPEQSASPEQSVAPERCAAPEQSMTPEESASPERSAAPEQSASPKTFVAPEESASLNQSASPERSAAPEESAGPELCVAPEQSASPEQSVAPEQSTNPEKFVAPEESASPKQSVAPELSTSPEKTVAPEESASPKQSVASDQLVEIPKELPAVATEKVVETKLEKVPVVVEEKTEEIPPVEQATLLEEEIPTVEPVAVTPPITSPQKLEIYKYKAVTKKSGKNKKGNGKKETSLVRDHKKTSHTVDLIPGEYQIVKVDRNDTAASSGALPANADLNKSVQQMKNCAVSPTSQNCFIPDDISRNVLDTGKWLAYVIDDKDPQNPKIDEVSTDDVADTIAHFEAIQRKHEERQLAADYAMLANSPYSRMNVPDVNVADTPRKDAESVRNILAHMKPINNLEPVPRVVDVTEEEDDGLDDLTVLLKTDDSEVAVFRTEFAQRTAPLFAANTHFKEFCRKYASSKYTSTQIGKLIRCYIDKRIVFHYEMFEMRGDKESCRIAKSWTVVNETTPYVLMIMLYLNSPTSNVHYFQLEKTLFPQPAPFI